MSEDWSETKPTIELIKSMVTLPQVLELLGIECTSVGKFRLREEDATPSVQAYEDHAYDFGSGKHYDVLDLVMEVKGWDLWKAMTTIWNRGLRAGLEPGDVETLARPEPIDFAEELSVFPLVYTVPGDVHYGHLYPDPLCRVDAAGNLLIPHRHDGTHGVKVRSLTGQKSAWPGSQFTAHLYKTHGNNRYFETAILLEGESDLWALEHFYGDNDMVDVYALPSGAGAWKDHWLEELEGYSKVVICFDNDRAGEAARDKVTRKVGWDRAAQMFVPQLLNDVREAIGRGWTPKLP